MPPAGVVCDVAEKLADKAEDNGNVARSRGRQGQDILVTDHP